MCAYCFFSYAHELFDEMPELATSFLLPLFFITKLEFIPIFTTSSQDLAGPVLLNCSKRCVSRFIFSLIIKPFHLALIIKPFHLLLTN